MRITYKKFAAIVKSRRIIANYSQEEFANAIGMSGQQYYRFERMKDGIPSKYVKKLAEVANMDLNLALDLMAEDFRDELNKSALQARGNETNRH